MFIDLSLKITSHKAEGKNNENESCEKMHQ